MKQNWEYKKLGDVCDFINGFAFKSDKFRECGLPVLRISNIKNDIIDENGMVFFSLSDYRENFDNYEVLPGDIVIAMSGATTGKIGIHIGQKKYYLNQRVGKFVIKDHSIDNRFLFYYLKTISLKIFNDAMGVAQPNISSNQIKNYDIPVPPLAEQQRIVAKLDLLTGIIDKQNAQLKELDNLAQAIFYDMFGDPIDNSKDWEIKTIQSVAEKYSDGPFGSNLKSEHYQQDGVRIIRLQNIGVNEFVDLDKAFISEEHYEVLKKYSCYPGDVVIGTLGEPNLRACVIPNSIHLAVNKADCILCRLKKDLITAIYFSYVMNEEKFVHAQCQAFSHGQTRARISAGQLKNAFIPLPPLALQQSFAEKIQSIEKQKSAIKTSIADTQKLLDYTMDKYFG